MEELAVSGRKEEKVRCLGLCVSHPQEYCIFNAHMYARVCACVAMEAGVGG